MNTHWAKKATTVAVLGAAGVLALGGVASAVEAPPVGHAVTQDDPNPNPGTGSDDSNCTNQGNTDQGDDGGGAGTTDGSINGDAVTDDPNATAPDGSGSSDKNCASDQDGNAPAANAPDGASDADPGPGPAR